MRRSIRLRNQPLGIVVAKVGDELADPAQDPVRDLGGHGKHLPGQQADNRAQHDHKRHGPGDPVVAGDSTQTLGKGPEQQPDERTRGRHDDHADEERQDQQQGPEEQGEEQGVTGPGPHAGKTFAFGHGVADQPQRRGHNGFDGQHKPTHDSRNPDHERDQGQAVGKEPENGPKPAPEECECGHGVGNNAFGRADGRAAAPGREHARGLAPQGIIPFVRGADGALGAGERHKGRFNSRHDLAGSPGHGQNRIAVAASGGKVGHGFGRPFAQARQNTLDVPPRGVIAHGRLHAVGCLPFLQMLRVFGVGEKKGGGGRLKVGLGVCQPVRVQQRPYRLHVGLHILGIVLHGLDHPAVDRGKSPVIGAGRKPARRFGHFSERLKGFTAFGI